MRPKPKRVVAIADAHCGHLVGLTPIELNPHYAQGTPEYKLTLKRRQLYTFYKDQLEALKPIDVLLVLGDMLDGKGEKSGGTELITTDRSKQIDIAATAIREAEAGKIVMVFGTPYHVGIKEDWELELAKEVKAEKIGGHDFIDVNGLIFDIKHFVGRSEVPHGRYTAMAREWLWSVLWAEHDEYPRADIILRAHTHYFAYCGGYKWLGIIAPSLQGLGTKFGVRRMSGTVDFGLLSFDVTSKEEWKWRSHIQKIRSSRHNITMA